MSERSIKIKYIVIIAMFSALLSGGKLALMSIPNIEVVTLFIILYSYSFGLKISLPATLIFCITELFLFGFNTWLISYFIYWPLLSIFSSILAKKAKKTYIYAVFAAFMTVLFGVISSAVDAIIASDAANINFFVMFSGIYTRGIVFYVTHIVSNLIFIALAFPLLAKLFQGFKEKFIGFV